MSYCLRLGALQMVICLFVLPTIAVALAAEAAIPPSTSSESAIPAKENRIPPSRTVASPTINKLQAAHPVYSPSETLQELARQCDILGISDWDVYGDFDDTAVEKESSFTNI